MRALRRIISRLVSPLTTHRDESRLQAEIEDHLARQTAENIRAGLPPAEARRQAMLKFGALEGIKESYRDQRGLPLMESLITDLRQALRRLRLSPAFTLTTVVTLALGIGATTSIFTLAHAVLLKSLPVAKPDELYRLGKSARCCYWGGATWMQKDEFSLISYDLYTHFRDNNRGFAELAAFSASIDLFGVRRKGVPDPAQSYPGEYVSGNYFAMFGIRPYLGRAITPDDDRNGAAPVAMMSYRLWDQRYAASPTVIGSVFTLDEKPYTIIGITPPGFYGDQLRNLPPDFYLPLHADAADLSGTNLYWLDVIGRIRPGVNPASIEVEMRTELKQWLRAHWTDMNANDRSQFAQQTLYLRPGGAGITSMREQYEHWLRILMMVSGFVLLIVCANVANLMLLRGIERRQQTSLSMALGARAGRVVRQALTESLVLSLLGCAAGLAIAFAGAGVILHLAFPTLPGLSSVPIDAAPSTPVLAFAVSISLLTGIAFGIAPAWMATRVNPIEALRGAGRASARRGALPRKALVVMQAALSMAVLSASGLLTSTLHRLEHQDFGFVQDHRLVIYADPRQAGRRADQVGPLYQRIHDSLAAIPGVSAVALCIYTPMGNNNWGAFVWAEGHPPPGPADDAGSSWDRVTAGYFDVIGNPIISGRGITEQDTDTSRHIAVINEAFARKFFPHEDPIGRHFGQFSPGSDLKYEIVGIARDARYLNSGLDKPVQPFFFLPDAQHDTLPGPEHLELEPSSHFLRNIVIELRTGVPPPLAPIRQAMASVDPNIPILSIRTLTEQVASNFTQQRLIAGLTSAFAGLSLLLASIGLYGVIAYNASCRMNEIGVRMAVGAAQGDIVTLVLRGGFLLILPGLLIGLPLALSAGRFLGNQLYGVSPFDPVVISVAALSLALSGFVASLIPAFRASSISPVEALRAE